MTSNQKGSDSNKQKPTSQKPHTTPVYTALPQKQSNPYKKYFGISIALGILLLGALGYIMYQNNVHQRNLEMKIAALEEADKLRIELEDQYNQALADLEDLRGNNEELNTLIHDQKATLEEQKNKIARLIRQKRNFENAREEIDQFKVQIDELLIQAETLKAENEALAAENAALSSDKSALEEDLKGQMQENSQLSEAKAILVSEKEVLTKKVNLASVIQVKNVTVDGYKLRGDKQVRKKSAKTIDQLKVCFTTEVNEVTAPGEEKFYIRIINPIGETIAVEELGSGKIINKKTGEEVPFTQVKAYNYGNDEAELCFIWQPTSTNFQRGSYKVEVYNKGHKAGTGSFTLK